MLNICEYYKNVYRTLKQFEDRILGEYRRSKLAEKEFYDARSNILQQQSERMRDIEGKIVKVKAFIDIAKTHTAKLVLPDDAQSFDSKQLSRLSVQIDTSSSNDIFASKLFTDATAQLMYLERERQSSSNLIQVQLERQNTSYEMKRKQGEDEINKRKEEVNRYLHSTDFTVFIRCLQNDRAVFNGQKPAGKLGSEQMGALSIGIVELPIPIPPGMDRIFSELSKGYCDPVKKCVFIPVQMAVDKGQVMVSEYENDSEHFMLMGIQSLILNVARYYGEEFGQIVFIDPIRFNASSLGCLSHIVAGSKESLIDIVPPTMEDVQRKINSIIMEMNFSESKRGDLFIRRKKKFLCVFQDFPQSYDGRLVAQIQQLCMNAERYGMFIILTHNRSSKNLISSDPFQRIKTIATNIMAEEGSFKISFENWEKRYIFTWYKAPDKLPSDISKIYIDERPVLDLSNDYKRRVGFGGIPMYKKGDRALVKIPYGVDTDGNIQYLDFEDSNFATFICGASRAGKSTLLHTLITGLIKNSHPDDIEIWLIDFKMTEFSRYATHTPPHVRYIILDESPELVYDIIDRLTEILVKRQNIFKGKWLKLEDVPSEKYMPAIMVIIDEFSVMSQIIADSITTGKENYGVKLQMLLAKGAALGFHFIFSSQGFTSGTRGLNDFSKKQIQQRIAMKTEYNEIRETLDIKSVSDEDKILMERLPRYHTLARIPIDERGNHLKISQVLHISDYREQETLIQGLAKHMNPVHRYDASDLYSYIDKRKMIIDGCIYMAFEAKRKEMEVLCGSQSFYEDAVLLFVGEPRRMMELSPIMIINEFCENILLVAPLNEKMAASSIVLSIGQSLKMQGRTMEIWSTKRNPVYCQIGSGFRDSILVRTDMGSICERIRAIKRQIESKADGGDQFFVLLGFESILADMGYQFGNEGSGVDHRFSQVTYEKRKPDEPDLNSRLESALSKVRMEGRTGYSENRETNSTGILAESYDARADLRYILTNGPRMGYHFMMIFGTVGDIQQVKVDGRLFKHKMTFRIAKADAVSLVGGANGSVVSELEAHSFRYSNGLDNLSFRPYLHPGLSWDGWRQEGDTAINTIDEEEEYLM